MRLHAYRSAIISAAISCSLVVSGCDLLSSSDETSSSNTAPVIGAVSGATSAYPFQTFKLKVSATDADDDAITFSASGMPLGATIDAAGGILRYTPALSDTGKTIDITVKASDGTDEASQSVTLSVKKVPSLEAGECIRLLYPNGGESLVQGDTLTVLWLQYVYESVEAFVAVSKDGGLSECTVNEKSVQFPDHKDAGGVKSFYVIGEKNRVALGVYKIKIEEQAGSGCAVSFGGDKMRVHVWDEYATLKEMDETAYCETASDRSNADFSIAAP